MNFTPAEAARRFEEMLGTMTITQREGQALMARVVKYRIKETYGDPNKIEELAPSTESERARLGFPTDTPLVRTGELLRDSIKIETTATGFAVGSEEIVAAYQEFGTAHIPPRPAVAIGAMEAEPEVREIMVATAGAMLGQRRHLDELAATAPLED